MKFLRFERTLAWRYFLGGRGQTVLTVSTIGVGVIVIIFITSLIMGAKDHFTEQLTDVLPHVTIQPLDQVPTAMTDNQEPVSAKVEQRTEQTKNLDQWQQALDVVDRAPGVTGATPAILEQGFISAGGKRMGVTVYGADPDRADKVTRVSKYTYAGRYLGLGPDEAVVNYKIVKEMNLVVGSHIRLASAEGVSSTFIVVGLYDSGSESDVPRVFVNLRAAQRLYQTGRSVRTILVRVDDLFSANITEAYLKKALPLKVESWMTKAPMYASALGIYNAVAALVSGFSLIASAFAISSVLIVSVTQKNKQIGILKSMGAKRRQIFRLFVLEGVALSIIGASVGALLGVALIKALGVIKRPPMRMGGLPESLFPSQLTWQLVVISMCAAIATTIFASALPARRAAGIDPVEIMR